MNRKKAIQNILALAVAGASSISIYEWINSGHAVDVNELLQKKQLIAELAETIIPRTDTSGAKDAKVEEFIIKMIKESDQKSQHNFISGLVSLEEYTLNKYDRSFIKCTTQQKFAILKHFEDKATYSINLFNRINNKLLGPPFFNKLKDLTVEGYCTSQLGATQGMAYNYIPVKFKGCMPLQKNQKAWATK